ncbi:Protein HIRA [Orchesella cincta]|uniref:Protein HIRA n=1 Tax=Orchesella cincta TaxID=48709 RepID=A0A1D2NCE8_ORCCI|nr:Protein HIRA [Orchesella cincta]
MKSEQAIFMQVKCKDISNNQSTVDWRKSMVSSIENVKGFNETSSGKVGDTFTSKSQDSTVGRNSPPVGNDNEEPMEVDVVQESGKRKNDFKVATPSISQESIQGVEGSKEDGAATTATPKLVNGGEGDTGVSKNKVPLVTVPKPGDAASSEKQSGAGVLTGSVATLIAVRKKKHLPDDGGKPAKKAKLIPVSSGGGGDVGNVAGGGVVGTGVPQQQQQSSTQKIKESHSSHHVASSSLTIPHTAHHSSPHGGGRSESVRNRLPPMKIETVLHLQVDVSPDCSYSLQVTNHNKRPDGMCHQLACTHNSSSFNGLEWTLCTDAPICGLTGDMHRIIALCENATAHVLDIKGRYAFPPSCSPVTLSGAFLVVVTTKAFIHVWNIHAKTVVLKSESLLPLLTQYDPEKDRALDVARIQVAAGGLPIIILNTGKTFMYSLELTTWFMISDPRGLVSSPLTSSPYDQTISGRLLFSGGRLRNKPEPAIVSHIKLKLATCTEMKNADGIKQWLIALAKSLATHELGKELHQLCEDLLGPTHSAAKVSSKWNPKIVGLVDKRKVLRQILTLLLEDLKFQEFYSEFDELLRDVESQETTTSVPTISPP